jgi:hypothetical protein
VERAFCIWPLIAYLIGRIEFLFKLAETAGLPHAGLFLMPGAPASGLQGYLSGMGRDPSYYKKQSPYPPFLLMLTILSIQWRHVFKPT